MKFAASPLAALLLLFHVASAATESSPASRGLLLDATLAGQAVVAAGERGNIVRSEDSGLTWISCATPTRSTLTGISFVDSAHGWAVGHDGTVLVSDDGGQSWTSQAEGLSPDISFLDVLAIDVRHVVAVGAFGVCFETLDGGRHWAQRQLSEAELHFNQLQPAEPGVYLIAGEWGTLLRVEDFAQPAKPIPLGYEGSFHGLVPLRDGSLIVHGLRGHAFRAPASDAPWTPIEGLPPVLLGAGVQLRNGVVVLAGQARHFAASIDGGETFSAWQTPLTTAVAALLEAPDGSLLAFGEAGATRLVAPSPATESAPSP